MKNNKNPYYITLDDIRARSTPVAVKVLEGSSGGKMPNTTEGKLKSLSCMFIQIMTSHYIDYIVLSTPVENLANSPNPVESGLVFEMVRFRPNLLQSGPTPSPAPGRIKSLIQSHTK